MTADTLERHLISAVEAERSGIAAVDLLLERRDCARLVGSSGEEIELPDSAYRALRDAVHQLRQGHAVAIVPVHTELTTQEAADMLNVSRQYFVRLLDGGRLPYHRVGTHRRVRFGDLMEYKRHRDQERREGLRRLTRLSEDLGLYE